MENNTLQDLFEVARKSGLCYNQAQFAKLIGVDRSAVSNGIRKGASPYLLLRAEKILQENGIIIGENNGTIEQSETSPDFSDILQEMAAQREMYDRHLSEAFSIIKSLTTK